METFFCHKKKKQRIRMKKYIHDLKIISNTRLNGENFMLECALPDEPVEIFPGQFVEVLVKDSVNTFLRRPFSVHDVDKKKNSIHFFIKIVGDGSAKLSTLIAGDFLNVMYPLGKGFTISEKKKVLLVGGGCGMAPLLYLARTLKEKNNEVTILLGGRTEGDILEERYFEDFGKVYFTTETGCLGEKGFVTDHSILKSNNTFDRIYTCGPEPMMKAVAKYAKQHRIDCEVSLENTMACGIGACLCCVTETKEGNKCVCTEGPVFNINELSWQI